MSTVYMLDAHGGQTTALSPLKMELPMAVNHHEVAGKGPWVFCKRNKCP